MRCRNPSSRRIACFSGAAVAISDGGSLRLVKNKTVTTEPKLAVLGASCKATIAISYSFVILIKGVIAGAVARPIGLFSAWATGHSCTLSRYGVD